MHFYHVFIACSLYSFRYVYHTFISYISYSSTYHLIYYLSNGSYSISYYVHVIFLYIYYFHGYILYHLLCSIFMYCYHVLSSCTIFMGPLSRPDPFWRTRTEFGMPYYHSITQNHIFAEAISKLGKPINIYT